MPGIGPIPGIGDIPGIGGMPGGDSSIPPGAMAGGMFAPAGPPAIGMPIGFICTALID
jgi:hypothetical protein